MTRWPVANSALNLWEGRPWAARVRPTESSDLARGLSEPKLQVLSAPVVLRRMQKGGATSSAMLSRRAASEILRARKFVRGKIDHVMSL